MNFLFIHGNYPAQFKYLAPALAKSGHKVVFLTNREDANEHSHEGIIVRNYKLHRNYNKEGHHYLQSTEDAILHGQAVAREVNSLIEENFYPRVVISHGGTGVGLFIKDIVPNCIHIGYFEWYFNKETTKYLISDFNLDAQLNGGLRNLPILQELERCDAGVVPTEWQRRQFPNAYREKIHTIFDGIDRSFFFPKSKHETNYSEELIIQNRETKEKFKIPEGSKIISYATRGMEPLRGFPEFMRMLPTLLNTDEKLYAVIAGADRRAYSFDAPSHNGSWKMRLIHELKDKLPKKRVIFTGLLNYTDYRSLLWRTNLHCYFTRPYVTSWSFFEAAACGAKIITNRNQATEDVAHEGTVTWADIDNQEDLIRKALKTIRSSKLEQNY